MPAFTFTSPDGKSYTVNGPDGATQEQAFSQLQSGLKNGAIKEDVPPAAAPPSTTPQMDQARTALGSHPGMGDMLGHAAMDVGGTVARAVGATADVATNAYHSLKGEPTVEPNSPESRAAQYSAPFGHESDKPPANWLQGKAHEAGQAIEDSGPLGQTVMRDVVPPVSDIAQGVGAVAGVKAAGGAALRAADAGVNALNKPTGAQAATRDSNPLIGRMRADGFKIAGNDVRAAVNAPDSDIHGTTRSTPDTTDAIQRHNQARATEVMAQDTKLPNTRAVNPDEIDARLEQEGRVYDQVGQAVGRGRTPTPNLDHDLATAAPSAATPAATKANADLVHTYREHFAGGLDGPDAVQMVRELRNEAHTRMTSNDANDQSLGRTQMGIATAIENEMMRQLPAHAQELKTTFPEARMQYAKLSELKAVSDGGQVNPSKVLQLKRSGAPLSGAAAAVANASDVAPESMMRAGGTPEIAPYAPTHTGLIRDAVNIGKRVVHKIPGMNPATDAYQEAHYGPEGGTAATPPASSAPNVSRLPPPVDLQPPPGNAGRVPPTQGALPLTPGREPPPPFELAHPEGTAFEPTQRPLVRPNTAGDVMERAQWDREALARVQRYKGENPSKEGPPVYGQNPPGKVVRKERELTPGEKLRKKLGEAMK